MEKKLLSINGIQLSVKEDGSGPDMVLIHGKSYSKENMDRLFDHYKESFHVVSYDVRGHGESSKPSSFTLDDDTEDLRCLVNEMGLEDPIVIGFSMGSYIALKTAEKYPDLFSKLVLIGTKGGGETSSTQRIQQEAEKSGLTKAEIMEQMVRRVFAPQVTYEEIGTFDNEIKSSVTLTKEQQDIITESLHDFDLISDSDKVSIPVLLLTGEYDGINPPEEGRKVAEALQDARFEVVPDAGHIAFFENPERVFELTDEFLKDRIK